MWVMENRLPIKVPSTHPAVCAGVQEWPPGQHLRYWLHCFAWADLHLLMFDYFSWYFGYFGLNFLFGFLFSFSILLEVFFFLGFSFCFRIQSRW